jgi:hypothetical protein
MSVATSKTFFPAFFKTLGLLWVFILMGLYLDSYLILQWIAKPQWVANSVMLIGFFLCFSRVTARIKEQMITAVIIAVVGEYLFSIALGMYTYRLENVPHYVPLGHALVYVGVLYFTKTTFSRLYKRLLEKVFTIIVLVYAAIFLIFENDVFGFLMTLLIVFILRNRPRERLFYLSMYLTVAYLEIIGTNFLCWKWPNTAFDIFSFLPSANPPSGISFFYFGLDLGCLWLYKKRHTIAWKRMKNQRLLRLK